MICIVCEDEIIDSILSDENKIGKCSICKGNFHGICGNLKSCICNSCQRKCLDEMFKKEECQNE